MDDLTKVYQAINAVSQKINDVNAKLDRVVELYNAQRQADIDYMAMETGVDLDQDDAE